MKRELSRFTAGDFIRGRSKFALATWFIIQNLFFKNFLMPARGRVILLQIFGAKIGKGVQIRRGVRVHFPWNLEIGDDCWIGEEVWFINHVSVSIADNVAISQGAIISSGGHDHNSRSLTYKHAPVIVKSGAWVCLDAKVLPGTVIGECSVIAAGEVARGVIPDYSMLIGGQLKKIDPPT
jgi:putative colanic acid biosynthesis acetyltransferase WcaF